MAHYFKYRQITARPPRIVSLQFLCFLLIQKLYQPKISENRTVMAADISIDTLRGASSGITAIGIFFQRCNFIICRATNDLFSKLGSFGIYFHDPCVLETKGAGKITIDTFGTNSEQISIVRCTYNGIDPIGICTPKLFCQTIVPDAFNFIT